MLRACSPLLAPSLSRFQEWDAGVGSWATAVSFESSHLFHHGSSSARAPGLSGAQSDDVFGAISVPATT